MKTVIIRETTALIMRPSPLPSLSTASHLQPNIQIRFSSGQKSAPRREKNVWHAHAQYYAAITFNQIVLSTSEAAVPLQMMLKPHEKRKPTRNQAPTEVKVNTCAVPPGLQRCRTKRRSYSVRYSRVSTVRCRTRSLEGGMCSESSAVYLDRFDRVKRPLLDS